MQAAQQVNTMTARAAVWLAFICETHVLWCEYHAHSTWSQFVKIRPGIGEMRADPGSFVCPPIPVKSGGIVMEWSFLFFFNSALLGVGLAMDAFSVSMANGLHDPQMSRRRGVQIAGTFAIFQAVMPMTGWVCVHTIVELFSSFEKFIPWIALALLGYIGGKMLVDGIKGEEAEEAAELSAGALLMQGVATSIDALSVGFTISEYGWLMALAASHKAGQLSGEPSSTRISSKSVKVWARMEEIQALRKRSVLYTGTMMLISGCFFCCSCTINSSLLQVVFCRLSALLRHRSR